MPQERIGPLLNKTKACQDIPAGLCLFAGLFFHLPLYAAVSRQINNADAPCSSSRELPAACQNRNDDEQKKQAGRNIFESNKC